MSARQHAPRAAAARVVRRTWRLAPLLAVVITGGIFLGQELARPSGPLPMGATATMSFVQGPPLLLRVSNLRRGPIPPSDPAVRKIYFHLAMRTRNPTATQNSGDALASYCSVVSTHGTVYPSDLAISNGYTRIGIFVLQNGETRQGRVVALVPRHTRIARVTCQLGVDVANWAA
jgi:hypothetical protein